MTEHKKHFAVCVDNADYQASLIVRKLYEVIPDEAAVEDELWRVVDESGEDYLYHKSLFIGVELPADVEHALFAPRDMTTHSNATSNP